MLQAVLADRFRLQLHRETRELLVDALVVAKSLRLQISEENDPDSAHHRGRLIVDATGLKGVYDFSVQYEVGREKLLDRNVPVSEAAVSLTDDLVKAPGLRIESSRRLAVEMLVIDRISPADPD